MLIFMFLVGFGLAPGNVHAATTYMLSDDHKTIASSDGKTFTVDKTEAGYSSYNYTAEDKSTLQYESNGCWYLNDSSQCLKVFNSPSTSANSNVTDKEVKAAAAELSDDDVCGNWWNTNPFERSMCKTVYMLASGLQKWTAFVSVGIDDALNITAVMMDFKPTSGGPNGMEAAWRAILQITLSLLTLVLLIIAFANILNVDEKLGYGLNRMIPKIIIAILMAFFSFLLARVILDLAAALQSLITGATANPGAVGLQNAAGISGKGTLDSNFGAGDTLNGIVMVLFLVVLYVLAFIAGLFAWLITVVRVAMLWVLVALAPLAMLMNILPFTEQYNKMWWQEWWKWVFMGPAIVLMFYIASAVLEGFKAAYPGGQSMEGYMLLVIYVVCLFLSITIPMSMGGKIMAQAKKGIEGLGKAAGTKDFMALRTAKGDERRKQRVSNLHAKLATAQGPLSGLGRAAAGVNKKQAARVNDSLIATEMDNLKAEGKTVPEKQLELMTATGNRQLAIARDLSSAGLLPLGELKGANGEVYTQDQVLTKVANVLAEDAVTGGNASKEQSDVYVALANRSIGMDNEKISGAITAMSRISTAGAITNPSKMKAEHVAKLLKDDKESLVSLLTNEQKMIEVARTGSQEVQTALGEAAARLSVEMAKDNKRLNITSETTRKYLAEGERRAQALAKQPEPKEAVPTLGHEATIQRSSIFSSDAQTPQSNVILPGTKESNETWNPHDGRRQ